MSLKSFVVMSVLVMMDEFLALPKGACFFLIIVSRWNGREKKASLAWEGGGGGGGCMRAEIAALLHRIVVCTS
jgi:hypothetical protein